MNVKNKITELEAMELLGVITIRGTSEQIQAAMNIIAKSQSQHGPMIGGKFVCECGAELPDGHVGHPFGNNLCEVCIDAMVDTI